MTGELVRMVGIVKRFPGVLANDSINFELERGEVHGLLGENGAGKTTLMNILYGIYRPDKGEIYIEGRKADIRSPRDAIRLGVGRVPQFPELVERLSVAENLAVLFPEILISSRRMKQVQQIAEQYGLTVDLDAMVYELSLGERQRVEILKALLRGSKILILDEPTTVLTPTEVDTLFKVVRKMKTEGRGIVFVSHKLPEVFEITDRITVLRKGKVVATMETKEVDEEELVRLMLGNTGGKVWKGRRGKGEAHVGEEVLRVEDLYVLDDRGREVVRGVSFTVRRGEIFGIAGIAGNGQKELVEAITGLRKAEKGRILVKGEEISSTFKFRLFGSHIPDDRIGVGLLPSLSVLENIALTLYRRFSRNGFLDLEGLRRFAEKTVKMYRVVTPSLTTPAGQLSGGNIARLIAGREISAGSDLLLAVHPTFGLDVASASEIRRILLELKRKAAIILVSEDLEEILQLSDRIAVMYKGSFIGVMDADEADLQKIGLMMGGVKA